MKHALTTHLQAQDRNRKDPATPCCRSDAQARTAQGQTIDTLLELFQIAMCHTIIPFRDNRQSLGLDVTYLFDISSRG